MTATLLAESGGAAAYHATWRELLPIVEAAGGCDALIVDAPYSARTHAGHDDGTSTANRAADWVARNASAGGAKADRVRYLQRKGTDRRALNYAAWAAADVDDFVDAWVPLVRGWNVSLTDHALAPAWESAFNVNERYTFSPLACVEPGSRVRMTGDGPANWSCWAVVARPRSRVFASWGALPGAYVVPAGESSPRVGRGEGDVRVVGGKPLWLMRALVRDYTRPGDLVVDPCAGAGTTALACRLEGRRCITGDAMLEHAMLAAERIRALPTAADKRGTLALFGGAR